MLHKKNLIIWLAIAMLTAPPLAAQSIERDYDYDNALIDRYLDAEVWVDHSDAEYYEGDNVVIHYRANRDAFVAIYTIDTRGRVNLLFPSYPDEDNFIYGGTTYSLPGPDDDYDLTVTGPEGWENIQIVASRERFTIPDWYRNSGLVMEGDDRSEYMDFLNNSYFVRYGGQRFAYDRAAIYINEWEQEYYRPIYYPTYPSWTVCGNIYVDYPYGGSIYINGIYWGVAPLYIPRIAVGWHTITVYDHYRHCWEHDFHVSRYNTVVLNRTVIQPSADVTSKYKEVRTVGYRDPVSSGYPDYKVKNTVRTGSVAVTKGGGSKVTGSVSSTTLEPAKKHVRGSTTLIKSDRGYETEVSTSTFSGKVSKPSTRGFGTTDKSVGQSTARGTTSGSTRQGTVSKGTDQSTATDRNTTRKTYRSGGNSSGKTSSADGYYQKKSGRTSGSSSGRSTLVDRHSKGSSSSGGTVKKQSTGTSSRTGTVKPKSSGSSNKSSSSSSGSSAKQAQPRKTPQAGTRSSGSRSGSSGSKVGSSSGSSSKSSSSSSGKTSSNKSGANRSSGKRR